MGEKSCPDLCLCVESCCCNSCALSASRMFVMNKVRLQPSCFPLPCRVASIFLVCFFLVCFTLSDGTLCCGSALLTAEDIIKI